MSGRVTIVVNDKPEVTSGECPLTDGCGSSHPRAALESTTDNGRISGFFDGREVSFKLL